MKGDYEATRQLIRRALSDSAIGDPAAVGDRRTIVGGVVQLPGTSIEEMLERKGDLEFQLALCQSMISEGTILPFPFERSVVLLRKERRYAEELVICEYVALWCAEAEQQWDGNSAMHWRSPKLEKCVARIPKLKELVDQQA